MWWCAPAMLALESRARWITETLERASPTSLVRGLRTMRNSVSKKWTVPQKCQKEHSNPPNQNKMKCNTELKEQKNRFPFAGQHLQYNYFTCILLIYWYITGSHSLAQAGMKLIMSPRLISFMNIPPPSVSPVLGL